MSAEDPKQNPDHDIIVSGFAKFEAFATEMREKINTLVDGSKDHETRIRNVRKDVDELVGEVHGSLRTMKGVVTVASLLFTVALLAITWYVGVHK